MSYQDEVLNEVYNTNVLVNAIINFCKTREFNREYYGIPQDYVPMISNERNEYLSLLGIISEKLVNIENLNVEYNYINTPTIAADK